MELMPIADFPGKHNWGYDGVLPYAPDPAYGTPDELKALVDAAHGEGLMVILDVVYNHFGPDGAYIHAFAKPFFDEGVHTPWGAAIDFKKPEVCALFIHNALMWLRTSIALTACASTRCMRFPAGVSCRNLPLRSARAQIIRSHLVLENEEQQIEPAAPVRQSREGSTRNGRTIAITACTFC